MPTLRAALELLGLLVGCTAADAKQAYKRKALECHPDRNDNESAKEEFQALAAAYARVRRYHEGGGEDGDGDDGSAHIDQEIIDMLKEMFGSNLSDAAAKSIASTLRPGGAGPGSTQAPAPTRTNPALAERIAATRAKLAEEQAAARKAKADAEAAVDNDVASTVAACL